MQGYINSIESFSTLDGPGIRSVVFFQGCPLRCLYCHNPETWQAKDGKYLDSDDIIKSILKNINYISSNGGVTISGGEPFFQVDFLKDILMKLKKLGLHTAVDTSGYASVEDIDKVIDYTDLFIVDIKHMDNEMCKTITGKSNEKNIKFLKYLDMKQKKMWIRNVLVLGYTDNEAHINKLCTFAKSLNHVERLELLPYHDMAVTKYEKLNIEYRLKGLKTHNNQEISKIIKQYEKYYDKEIIV